MLHILDGVLAWACCSIYNFGEVLGLEPVLPCHLHRRMAATKVRVAACFKPCVQQSHSPIGEWRCLWLSTNRSGCVGDVPGNWPLHTCLRCVTFGGAYLTMPDESSSIMLLPTPVRSNTIGLPDATTVDRSTHNFMIVREIVTQLQRS
jgi:hypothetical protein